MSQILLYGYWRSTAAYRVRIALNLKELSYENRFIHLVKSGGEQKQASYLSINPEGLVPTLQDGDEIITQSLAIIEYLDEQYQLPALLPSSPAGRAFVRSIAQIIASDTHPLNNLRVLRYLQGQFKLSDDDKMTWYHHWVHQSFSALEKKIALKKQGLFCYGETPTIADICLIPQIYNAKRFNCDLSAYPTLMAINEACLKHPAFIDAQPERQPDAS